MQSAIKELTKTYLKSHDRELNSQILGAERTTMKQGHTESLNFTGISEFNTVLLLFSLQSR